MEDYVPQRYKALQKKARGGSRKAAMRLKCLDCSCWVATEVTKCTCNQCALYPFRTGVFVKKSVPEEV